MKRLTLLTAVVVALVIATGDQSFAQSASATQRLMFEVKPVVSLVVSGDPDPMIISKSSGDNAYRSVRDQRTRYSLVTNVEQMRILASLNEPMPAGTSLRVQLQSTRGISAGEVDLSRSGTPKEVVTGIRAGWDSDLVISYDFSAEPQVAELKSINRTVVLTLTN
jgi:hypothetical protein